MSKQIVRRLILGMVAFVLTVCTAFSDSVIMKNGDRFTGTIKQMTENKLVITAPEYGEITVDWSRVDRVQIDRVVPVKLATGEVLNGKIETGEEGMRIVSSTAGTTKAMKAEDIHAIKNVKEYQVKWSASALFGLTATFGNTEETSINFFTLTERKTFLKNLLKDKITIKGDYNLTITEVEEDGDEDSQVTARNGEIGIRYDNYFKPDLLSWFVLARVGFDRFRDLDLEAEEAAGVSYTVFKDSRHWLSVGPGLSQVNRFYKDAEDESFLALRTELDYQLHIMKGLDFYEQASIRNPFEGFTTEFTVTSETGLKFQLAKYIHSRFVFVVDYDHDPPDGIERTDKTLFLQIGVGF